MFSQLRLILAVAACIVPLWVATAIQAYKSYQQRQAILVERTMKAAQAARQALDHELATMQAALTALATLPGFAEGDFAAIHRQAVKLLHAYPRANILLADATGQEILDARRPFGTPLPKRRGEIVLNRLFYEGLPQVSGLYFGAHSGLPRISVDVPVRVGQAVRYDLAMSVPTDQLAGILNAQPFDPNWSVALLDQDGMVLAVRGERPPPPAGAPGQRESLPRMGEGMGQGGTYEWENMEGEKNVRVFSRSELSRWTVVIDVPSVLLAGELQSWLLSFLGGVLLSSVVAVTVGMLLARRLVGAARRIEDSEARFRAVADASPAAMWLGASDGRRLWFNRTWLEAAGRTQIDSMGWGWLDCVHADDRAKIRQSVAATMAKGQPWRCEYRVVHADGSLRWYLDSGVARRSVGGDKVEFVGSAVDITDMKQVETKMRRFHEVVEAAGDCLAFVDRDLCYRFVNTAYARMFQATPDDLIGRPVTEVVGGDMFRSVEGLLRSALGGEAQQQIMRRRLTDGSERMYHLDYRPFRSGLAQEGVVVSLHDLTDQFAAQREQRIAAAAFETQEGIVITDRVGRIVRVNHAFTRITGYEAAAVTGATPSSLIAPRHREAMAGFRADLEQSGTWQGEVWCKTRAGTEIPLWLTVSGVSEEGLTGYTHFVGAFTDFSQRKQAEDEIRAIAYHDPLTGLPNRRLLLDRLGQIQHQSDRSRHHAALLFIDLDKFKALNDSKGHAVGDQLLIQVAERLKSCVRHSDTVARLGGDEFVVLLGHLGISRTISVSQVTTVARKILKALNTPYTLSGHRHRCSPSIGATLFLGHARRSDDLIEEADAAMYQAKGAGRNQAWLHGASVPFADGRQGADKERTAP